MVESESVNVFKKTKVLLFSYVQLFNAHTNDGLNKLPLYESAILLT